MDEIIYSTSPITLGEQRLVDRIRRADAEAMALIVGRTNLNEEQVNALDVFAALDVLGEVVKAMGDGAALSRLARQFDK